MSDDEDPMLQSLRNWQEQKLLAYGWYCEMVSGYETFAGVREDMINAHTHGVWDKWEHPELQIVVPLRPQVAHAVLQTIVDKIREGEKFEPGKDYPGLIQDFNVRFRFVQGQERKLLRVILPDRFGNLDEDKMQGKSPLQYMDTED